MIRDDYENMKYRQYDDMKIGEDACCFCYMILSSIGFLYQLTNQYGITVHCENPKAFCLKHFEQESSFRYALKVEELEHKCNIQGYSLWTRCIVLLGVLFELVVYGRAVYIYYCKSKTPGFNFIRQLHGCVYAAAGITGAFICIFFVLPSVGFFLPSGGHGRRGFLSEMWASPLRGLAVFIIQTLSAPFRWIFHDQFKIELHLDQLHENFTCVEPEMKNGVLKCPIESRGFPSAPDPSYCESDFLCAKDCLVVFPSLVINSLAFIFASLVLFHRLLGLTHYITERETGIDLEATENERDTVKVNETSDRIDRDLSALDEASFIEMRNKTVGRSAKRRAGGLREEDNVYPRRFASQNAQKLRETKQNNSDLKKDSPSEDKPQEKVNSRSKVAEKLNENKEVSEEDKNLDDRASKSSALKVERKLERCTNGFPPTSSEPCENDGADSEQRSSVKEGFDIRRTGSKYRRERGNLMNSQTKENESSTSRKHSFGFKGEVVKNTNTESVINGRLEHEQRRKVGSDHSQGKARRASGPNGHLKQKEKVYRRPATNGVNDGMMKDCNGEARYEEEQQLSSSEDIVEGIEGLIVVEDETEYYMSGFRL